MHEAGGCQPITLTLAMELWPWTQWKRMGPVWAVVLGHYPSGLGKVADPRDSSIPSCDWDCGGMPLCSPTPAWSHAVHVGKWWMEGRRHEKIWQRHLFISGRCLGKEPSSQRGKEGKNNQKDLKEIRWEEITIVKDYNVLLKITTDSVIYSYDTSVQSLFKFTSNRTMLQPFAIIWASCWHVDKSKGNNSHLIIQLTFTVIQGSWKQSEWKMQQKWAQSII